MGTRDLCTSMNVALVVAGSEMTTMKRGPISPPHSTEPSASQQQQGTTAALPDPYSVPKEMGIFREVDSGSTITTAGIQSRILQNFDAYKARNKVQEVKQQNYVAGKTYFPEHQAAK